MCVDILETFSSVGVPNADDFVITGTGNVFRIVRELTAC